VASHATVLQFPLAVERIQLRLAETDPETATFIVAAPPPAFEMFPLNVDAEVGLNIT
jgi:hypothetical protein